MSRHHTTLISSCLPEGMRGVLNLWMVEVLAGVYVGQVSRRARDLIWDELSAFVQDGEYAALIEPAQTEQGFAVRVAGDHRYNVVDHAGLMLIARRHDKRSGPETGGLPDSSW